MKSLLLPRRASYRLLLLLPVNLLLLLALIAVIWFDNALNRGITYTPDPTPIPWTDGPQVGVNAYNLHLEPDPEVVTRTMELAHDLGVRYMRMQIPWDDIEIHGRGDFEDRRNVESIGVVSAWAKYDRIVETADRFDIELVMRVDRAPMWASNYFKGLPAFQDGLAIDPNSTGPPDDFEDYFAFMRTLAERYKGQVRFFQIWNEPNLLNEWNWQTPNPRDLVTLQCISYATLKEVNPDAVILFPSLAPTDGLDKRAPLTDLEYLDQFYQEGGGECFDIMSAQAYGLGQPPDEHRYVRLRASNEWLWTHPIDTRTDVSRVVLIREIMERNGDHHKPVWIGEFGWNSAPDSIPAERRFTWGQPVSEEQKATYIIDQIERAQREWPWMGVMHLWMLRYGGYLAPDPADPTPYFALVTRDWQVLPAYTRLQAYLEQPAVAGVGAHTWQHPAVETLPDGWRLRFSGTRTTLIGGLEGDLQVTLDGQPTTLERDGIDGQQALTTLPSSLGDGPHVLEIRAPNAAPPERFVVARDPPAPWFWVIAPILLFGLLLVSGAVTMHTLFQTVDGLIARTSLGRLGPRAWLLSRAGERVLLLGMFLSIVLFYRASTELPLTLVGLALFGLLALLRPDLGLLFVPLTVPLFFMPKGVWDTRFGIRPEGIEFPLHEIVLLVVVGATLARAFLDFRFWIFDLRSRISRLKHPIQASSKIAPIALFLVAGTVGLLIVPAEGRGVALREWRWLIVEPLLFYGLLRYHLRPPTADRRPPPTLATDHRPQTTDQGPLMRVVGAFVLGGAIVGLVGILQFLGLNLAPLIGTKVGFSDDSIFVEGVRRVTSVYGHPNNLGLYMGRIWPIAAALAFAGLLTQHHHTAKDAQIAGRAGSGFWSPRRLVSQLSHKATLFYGMCALLALGGLVVSFSRGALLGAVGAFVVLALLLGDNVVRRSWRVLGLLAVLALLGGGVLVVGAVFGIERLNLLGETTGIRLKTWASSLAMLRDQPLFGIGLDQFVRLYPQHIDPSLANTNEINTSHPHNLVLDIWLRLGLLGLLAFGWLIWQFWAGVRRWGMGDRRWEMGVETSHAARSTRPFLRIGVVAAMTAALLHGLVDNFYFLPDLAFAFWLLLALGKD